MTTVVTPLAAGAVARRLPCNLHHFVGPSMRAMRAMFHLDFQEPLLRRCGPQAKSHHRGTPEPSRSSCRPLCLVPRPACLSTPDVLLD